MVQRPRDGARHGIGDGARPSWRGHMYDLLTLLRKARRRGERVTLCGFRRGAPLHRSHQYSQSPELPESVLLQNDRCAPLP